jgi:hypothetical protein
MPMRCFRRKHDNEDDDATAILIVEESPMPEQTPADTARFPQNRKRKDGKVSLADRQRRAVDLRSAGATYQQIAQALGYAGTGSAWKAVHAALRRQEYESVAELRQLQGDRLDTALRAVWPRVVTGDDGAIATMLRIEKRRAALFGLDAPTKQEITGRDGGPLQLQPLPALDFSQLSDAEVEMLAALAERIGIDETDR